MPDESAAGILVADRATGVDYVMRQVGTTGVQQAFGATAVHLPLGSVAGTDPAGGRAALIGPLWLLASAAAGAVVLFVDLHLALQ